MLTQESEIVTHARKSDDAPSKPRKNPCASCPYRLNVPSGIWDESEYNKLPAYDGEIHEQTADRTFMCHQQDGCVCSGWLGHLEEPTDMLAVRLGLMRGVMDPECLDYTTDVPLFESGAAAAAHGLKHINEPQAAAIEAAAKIVRKNGGTPTQKE